MERSFFLFFLSPFKKLSTLLNSSRPPPRAREKMSTIINIPRIAFGKIVWIGGENLLSSSIKKRTRYAGRLSVWKMTSSLIIPKGEWMEGERRQKDRGREKGEERAWITMRFDAEGESRDERISRRPDYERDRATLHRAILTLANTLCTMVSSAPSPPSLQFHPRGLFSAIVRIVIIPTDSKAFYSRLLHDFRMINRCVIDCVIFDRLEINCSFS